MGPSTTTGSLSATPPPPPDTTPTAATSTPKPYRAPQERMDRLFVLLYL